MGHKIKVGIVGYGNLGRGAEAAIAQQPDMDLVAVFSRRGKVNTIDPNIASVHIDEIENYQDNIDVMILCGGSATDLPEQTPKIAQMFNTVDSYDTHAKIPEYFEAVDKVATSNRRTSIISVGWDPGLFSINRVMSEAILADGKTYTFWGKGLSQGHSDAVRRVKGVKAGVQYTIPSEEAIEKVRNGEYPDLTKHDSHKRECYIVPEEGENPKEIEELIKTMPDYFVGYETTVHFITEEELAKDHSHMPHGGFVMRSGNTGEGNNQLIEFSLNLSSNPEFTASVLIAYARAAHRLYQEGQIGAKTVYDVGPGYISPKTAAELRKDYL